MAGEQWIKPTHLRSLWQRTAIAIFNLATREGANQIIERGLFVAAVEAIIGPVHVGKVTGTCLPVQTAWQQRTTDRQDTDRQTGGVRSFYYDLKR